MPTKKLPQNANIDHLRHQARDILRALRQHGENTKAACQRVREFHPAYTAATDDAIRSALLSLSDAQLTISREYGYANWRRLRTVVQESINRELDLPHHERIEDAAFRRAVDFIDEGNVDALDKHLKQNPDLIRQRVTFDGGNYFGKPALLEFIAENPTRHETLPDNIVSVAQLLLDRGASDDKDSVDTTLELVASGRVVRECGFQRALIALLCHYGANADGAMYAALGHGEFDAVEDLITAGATVDLVVAAGTDRIKDFSRLLAEADAEKMHQALAVATLHGRTTIVEQLLIAGEDPNRYNPNDFHAHTTPLHQAALAGHVDVVKLLVKHGADPQMRDIHINATALGWAQHGGDAATISYLSSLPDS